MGSDHVRGKWGVSNTYHSACCVEGLLLGPRSRAPSWIVGRRIEQSIQIHFQDREEGRRGQEIWNGPTGCDSGGFRSTGTPECGGVGQVGPVGPRDFCTTQGITIVKPEA